MRALFNTKTTKNDQSIHENSSVLFVFFVVKLIFGCGQEPTMSPWTIDGAGNHLSFSDLLVYYPSLCVGIGFLRPFRGVPHVRLGYPEKEKRTFGNREKQFPSREILQAADIVAPVVLLPQARLNVVLLKHPVT